MSEMSIPRVHRLGNIGFGEYQVVTRVLRHKFTGPYGRRIGFEQLGNDGEGELAAPAYTQAGRKQGARGLWDRQ